MHIPIIIASALFLFATTTANAKVVGEEITYKDGGTNLKGYIAYDDAIKGKRPGILVVHEWWGNNDYSRRRADMLASLGYTALALDMYGEGKTADNPTDASKLSGMISSDIPLMKSRFDAALKTLNSHPTVDPKNNGAIGYCFGGGVVLSMAREGVDLKGAVSFHGNLVSKAIAHKGGIKPRLLVANGAADKFVPADQIANFKSEMKHAGADLTFIDYPGALHAFTNPAATANGKKFNIPIAYNEAADKKSWEDMKKFFAEVFRK